MRRLPPLVLALLGACNDPLTQVVPPCLDGQDRSCVPDDPRIARCGPGSQRCVDAAWSACVPLRLPAPEVCDGLDNDCDGTTDVAAVGTGVPCEPPEPYCALGVVACRDRRLLCTGWTRREPEVCDGKDNDCNGIVDDIAPVSCYGSWFEGISPGGPPPEADRGECRRGHARCVMGARICDGAIYPSARDCTTRDNDCDGVADSTDRGPDVDIVAAVDMSGSMTSVRADGASALAVVTDRLRAFAWAHRGSARIRLGVILVPGAQDRFCELASDLAPPEVAGPVLVAIAGGNNSSQEPTADCPLLAATGGLRLSWRASAARLYLAFSDEEAQSYLAGREGTAELAVVRASGDALRVAGITYYGWHRPEDWPSYAPLIDRSGGRLYPLENSTLGRDLAELLEPRVACR